MSITKTLIVLLLLPVLLFLFEFYLCKKKSKFVLVLPIISACFFIVIGVYALIISAILFGIYFSMKHIEKEKQDKQSELNKMYMQDL